MPVSTRSTQSSHEKAKAINKSRVDEEHGNESGGSSSSSQLSRCSDDESDNADNDETQDTEIQLDDEDERERDEDDEDEDAGAPSSEDNRTEEEIEAIQYEIYELLENIDISKRYKIIDRLGEGTFSSVYKAIDCQHPFYDNSKWAPSSSSPLSLSDDIPSSSSLNNNNNGIGKASSSRHSHSSSISTLNSSKDSYQVLLNARKQLKAKAQQTCLEKGKGGNPVYVALKRIYVTSSPIRIANELAILADLRNARNTCYLISAIRHEDQVIAVMPYSRHQDFRTYYRSMSLTSMRSYFKCLFSALADAHRQGIIHRDVKPANFLFDIHTQQGQLCDFGLAQRLNLLEWHSKCLHSIPEIWKGNEVPGAIHGKKMAQPSELVDQLEDSWNDWYDVYDADSDMNEGKSFIENIEMPPRLTSRQKTFFKNKQLKEGGKFIERWIPVTRHPAGQKIGHLKVEHDKRPSIKANRAGTRGFRAPEVVLKCPDQTMALDIWSVGVTLLCFLTRRFPFFTSTDDTEALLEIGTIFGKRRLEKCAAQHNRTFLTNLPNIEVPKFDNLHDLVFDLNPNIFMENMPSALRNRYLMECNGQYDDLLTNNELVKGWDHSEWYEGSELFQIVDLMKKCLTLDCTRRLTAHDALSHPFMTGTWPRE